MIELYGKKVENFDNLPVLSETIVKLLKLLDDINSTNKSLARIISLDVVLTAKIISLANSPLYASKKPVNDVLQAINKLGRSEIKNMVMILLKKYMQKMKKCILAMKINFIGTKENHILLFLDLKASNCLMLLKIIQDF